jgi:hypothetical protein
MTGQVVTMPTGLVPQLVKAALSGPDRIDGDGRIVPRRWMKWDVEVVEPNTEVPLWGCQLGNPLDRAVYEFCQYRRPGECVASRVAPIDKGLVGLGIGGQGDRQGYNMNPGVALIRRPWSASARGRPHLYVRADEVRVLWGVECQLDGESPPNAVADWLTDWIEANQAASRSGLVRPALARQVWALAAYRLLMEV